MSDIRRVDCHVHYIPTDVSQKDFETRGNAMQGMMKVSLTQRPAWRDLGKLAGIMDETNVDLGLIIPNHTTFPEMNGRPSHVAYEAYNKSMSADLAKSGLGDRFVAMACVDPFDESKEQIAQLERSLQLPHIAGIGLITNYGNITLDDPHFTPIFKIAREYDVPVTVHPGGAWPSWYQALHAGESSFMGGGLGFFLTDAMAIFMMAHAGVFDRFPTVRFMFCQLGGCAAICCGRWSSGIKHYRIGMENQDDELPQWARHELSDIMSHLWLDTHTCNRNAMRMLIEEAGDHTIVLGGDYPVTLPDLGVDYAMAEIEALNLPPQVKRKLERDNGLALLGKRAPAG